MNIELARNREPWDAYVESAAPESLYHRWVWRDVIEETFGHQPYYLTAVEDGAIRGVLPLVRIRSRLFGNSLISIPFFSYGGVVADTEAAREGLLARAAELGRELGVRHIELRQGDETPMSWPMASAKVTMEIELPSTADEYWKRLSSGMRNKIRQGQKHNLRAQWGAIDALPIFYQIFATNMRNLGTPVYSRKFFEVQMRHLPDRIRILSLWDGEAPVAASFLTAHNRTLELPWSASLPGSRKKYSQVLMYWEFIRKAIAEGFQKIDLGRCTPGGGTYEYKRHWNPVERPLHWYYWPADRDSVTPLRSDSPKFKLATSVWKRLPLVIANGLGPRLVRSIP
ncbi:MAG: FemAB family XrtA/PEP-CTERM system-associated protein [Candidatus Binataceae bacterium]